MNKDNVPPWMGIKVKQCPYMSWDSKPVLGGNVLFVSCEMFRKWRDMDDAELDQLLRTLEVLEMPGLYDMPEPSLEMLKYATLLPVTQIEWKD